MKALPGLVMVFLVVLAGCAQAPGLDTPTDPGDQATTAETPQTTSSPSSLADPDSDVLGWENGVWYNEPIDVDQIDGLNGSELDLVVARSMARVEHVRGLEFEETVPVSVISRDEFREEQAKRSTPEVHRQFDNLKFEALMMIDEGTDSIEVQNENSGTAIGGYYSPEDGEIVVVSENTTSPKMNEVTLSQELYHALQDQKFGISSFDQSTRERHNAVDGLIEGDGNYVDYLYEQACQRGEWGDCLQDSGGSGAGGQLANYGPYILKFQPYSDGPLFVKQIHEARGWGAVNDLYENPPASTEQVIHPERYGQDEPAELTVEDRSAANWNRLQPEGRPNYGEVGEAGLFSMFMYPAYESGGQSQVIPAQSFFNYQDGSNQLRTIDPLNYSHPYSEGWNGDKFVAYTNEDGEGAYVWKLRWDSEADATEFVEGYRKLLEHRGATPVDGRQNTWRIPENRSFADAFSVERNGDTVVIVNAPTVEELPNVREGAAQPN